MWGRFHRAFVARDSEKRGVVLGVDTNPNANVGTGFSAFFPVRQSVRIGFLTRVPLVRFLPRAPTEMPTYEGFPRFAWVAVGVVRAAPSRLYRARPRSTRVVKHRSAHRATPRTVVERADEFERGTSATGMQAATEEDEPNLVQYDPAIAADTTTPPPDSGRIGPCGADIRPDRREILNCCQAWFWIATTSSVDVVSTST